MFAQLKCVSLLIESIEWCSIILEFNDSVFHIPDTLKEKPVDFVRLLLHSFDIFCWYLNTAESAGQTVGRWI